ncbi:MAG: flagellar assembly protein FliW, partial [Vulcanimicrobiaceae bacterium]
MKLVLDCSADSDAIAFPWGLPGLANHRWFHLLRLPQADGWSLLRGEGEPPVALFVVDPWSYFPDYRLQLPFYARLTLELERDEDAAVRCVVVPNDPECDGPSVN